jgi:FkbM family methyltransferase
VLEQYQSWNSTDPNGGKLYVRHTVTDPRFWISFHDAAYDPTRFSTFKVGYYYEKMLSYAFQEVLSTTTPINGTKHRVIDVGGNIGWFSLLSAANGAEVSTFEPNPNNYLRTCESMRLNGWLPCSSSTGGCLNPGESNLEELNSNIHIYPYGVSDREGELYFEAHEHNPGASKVIRYETNTTQVLRVVSLDYLAKELGWLDSDISILKIDVEGEELGVFRGAKELLRSQRVQNLFMEGTGTNRMLQNRLKEIMGLLLESGYQVHKIGGFRGPSNPMPPVPDGTKIVDHYLRHCLGDGRRKRFQCNLWWKLKLLPQEESVSVTK